LFLEGQKSDNADKNRYQACFLQAPLSQTYPLRLIWIKSLLFNLTS